MRRLWVGLLLLAALALTGCGPAWEIAVSDPGGQEAILNAQTMTALEAFQQETDAGRALPLERALYDAGYRLIEQVTLAGPDDDTQVYEWAAVADDAWLLADGRVLVAGETYTPAALTVQPDDRLDDVVAHLTDLAPTVAAALGLRQPVQASGTSLTDRQADHVLMLFMDGFGYLRFTEAAAEGLVPTLVALDPPLLALTVYPPVTVVSSATMLTGADPAVHGVAQRGSRRTDTETLFDVAAEAGLVVVAVEGDALAFEMRNADFTLSGDRDGNGGTNDNVLANALAVLDEGMPDLFWVHFHGIDDAGHSYGPGSPEETAAIREVDAAIAQLLDRVPDGTLVVIFADHGMHALDGEEGEYGNHGHLIARDMLIPIFIAAC